MPDSGKEYYACVYRFWHWGWCLEVGGPPSIAKGQKACTCDKGYYSETGLAPCSKCPENSFGTWISSYILGLDHIDRLDHIEGATQCSCVMGSYSATGTAPCQKCESGTTSVGAAQTSCTRCDEGFHSSTGNVPCTQCDEGTSTGGTGSTVTTCTLCAVGYYSPTGSAPCGRCLEDQTTLTVGSTYCYPLTAPPAGSPTPLPSPGPSNPTRTPSYVPVHTRYPTPVPSARPTDPHFCQQGFHSPTGQQPDCVPCTGGATNNGPGSSTCDQCVDGYFGVGGKAPCTKCPRGYTSLDSTGNREFCFACYGNGVCGYTEQSPGPGGLAPAAAPVAPPRRKPTARKSQGHQGNLKMHVDVEAKVSSANKQWKKEVAVDV